MGYHLAISSINSYLVACMSTHDTQCAAGNGNLQLIGCYTIDASNNKSYLVRILLTRNRISGCYLILKIIANHRRLICV